VCFTAESVRNPEGLPASGERCRHKADPSLYEILTFDQLATRVPQALVS